MAIDGTTWTGKTLLAAGVACLIAVTPHSAQLRSTASDTPPSPPGQLRISAVGDIMLGGTSEPVMQQYGYDYAFEQVKYLFEESNLVIGNLEGPLTDSETPYADKEYLFRTPPAQVVPALKKAGFNIMNLANNHIMDFGFQGLQDTMHALEGGGIRTVGAGNNLHQARRGTVVTIDKTRVGFLSYSLTFPKSFWATDSTPGTAFGHEHQIREDVARIKQSTDIVVVSYHWGQEKSKQLRAYQPLLAHAAIEAGASLVIGHHPHVLQAVERYQDGLILYSLGNFAFGSYSRSAEFSAIAHVDFKHGRFHGLQLLPINVLNVDINFQPHLLTGADADRVIDELNMLSATRNTRLSNQQGVAFLGAESMIPTSISSRH